MHAFKGARTLSEFAGRKIHLQCPRCGDRMPSSKPWIFTMIGDVATPAFDFTTRRQDVEFLAPNGAVYVFSDEYARSNRQWWADAILYVMPQERSVDIDTPTDLVIAKALFSPPRYDVSEGIAWRMAL